MAPLSRLSLGGGLGYSSGRMNWVFASPIKGPIWGGMANWFRNLAVGLQALGDRCVVIGRTDSRWPEVCRESGLTFEPFRFPGDFAFWAVPQMADILRRHNAEAGVVKGFRQARFLRYARPSLAVGVKLPFCYDLTDSLADRATYRFAVDRVFVDSFRTRRAFLEFPWVQENKIVAVHNGVALPPDDAERLRLRAAARERTGAGPDRLVVGYCGRFTAIKRTGEVLEAFLRAGLPGRAECWMMGQGPLQPELEARAAAPEFRGSVRFVGWVERTRDWLPACDVVIHPSGDEGLPNAVLEAMACGAGVIATRAGGTEEIIRDGTDGFLADIGDVDVMARRLSELAADGALCARLGAAARERVRDEFSLPQMIGGVRSAMRDAAGWRAAVHAAPTAVAGGWRQVRHPEFEPPADWIGLPHAPESRFVKDTPRTRVVQAGCGGRPVYAKLYAPAGAGDALRYGLRPARAPQNLRTAMRMALLGVPVVPHLAAAWRRRGLAAPESVLLTGVIPGAVPAADWPQAHPSPADLRRLATAAGGWLGRLHAAGISPHDLKATNILVTAAPDARHGLRFHLLDLDNCRTWGPVTARTAARNFRQFYRSFETVATRSAQLRFAAAYRRGRDIDRRPLREIVALLQAHLARAAR